MSIRMSTFKLRSYILARLDKFDISSKIRLKIIVGLNVNMTSFHFAFRTCSYDEDS